MVETLHRPWQDVEITDKFGTQSIMAPQHTTGEDEKTWFFVVAQETAKAQMETPVYHQIRMLLL